VAIEVIGVSASSRHVLGRLELAGLTPGPVGSAQVQVSFTLAEDGQLRVTAADRVGRAGSRDIYIRDQSLMPCSDAHHGRPAGAAGGRA